MERRIKREHNKETVILYLPGSDEVRVMLDSNQGHRDAANASVNVFRDDLIKKKLTPQI